MFFVCFVNVWFLLIILMYLDDSLYFEALVFDRQMLEIYSKGALDFAELIFRNSRFGG